MNKIIPSLTLLLLAACGGTDTDLETAFCIGLGSDAAATASASASAGDAPTVALGDARTDVTLPMSGDDYGGSIVFVADEAGYFAFGLGRDVPLTVRDSAGAEVPIVETVRGSAMCTELAVRYTVELAPAPYTLTFGPTDAAVLAIVAEESDDDVAQ